MKNEIKSLYIIRHHWKCEKTESNFLVLFIAILNESDAWTLGVIGEISFPALENHMEWLCLCLCALHSFTKEKKILDQLNQFL